MSQNICTCAHIKQGMECLKCGYPYCEAIFSDDGTDCGCTNPDCSVCETCGNHKFFCICKDNKHTTIYKRLGKEYRKIDRNEVIEEGAMQSWCDGELRPITNSDGKTVGDYPYNFSIERDFYNSI